MKYISQIHFTPLVKLFLKTLLVLLCFIMNISTIVAQVSGAEMAVYTDSPNASMKNIDLSGLIPVAANRNFSTREVVGQSYLNVSYLYTFASNIEPLKEYNDLQELQIGDTLNRFYSRNAEYSDSVSYENYLHFLKTNEEFKYMAEFDDNMRKVYLDVFTYPKQKQRLVSERFGSEDYQYWESSTNQAQWAMLPGNKEIMGYKCHRASITLRGRVWNVWFTSEIPFSYGPWKLGGLPGLILEAEEKEGLFSWRAIGISKPQKDYIYKHSESIKPPHNTNRHSVRKSTRKNNAKLLKNSWFNPMYMGYGNFQSLSINGKEVDMTTLRANRKYYPQLELE